MATAASQMPPVVAVGVPNVVAPAAVQPQNHGLPKLIFLGAIGGALGVTAVYPLDLSKTLLQRQRNAAAAAGSGTTLLAKETLFTVLKDNFARYGFFGLYRGLPANLVGVLPEKAVKLGVNQYCRELLGCTNPLQPFSYWREGLSALTAACSCVFITAPMELVKIRAQMDPTKTPLQICKELGLRGMFKGTGATLLRDIPFTTFYFTLFSTLKMQFGKNLAPGEKLATPKVFFASFLSGSLVAAAVTPADVIKTRLQSVDSAKYNGSIRSAFSTIVKEEGPKALFKGVGPRILIIGPLFAVALGTFEIGVRVL